VGSFDNQKMVSAEAQLYLVPPTSNSLQELSLKASQSLAPIAFGFATVAGLIVPGSHDRILKPWGGHVLHCLVSFQRAASVHDTAYEKTFSSSQPPFFWCFGGWHGFTGAGNALIICCCWLNLRLKVQHGRAVFLCSHETPNNNPAMKQEHTSKYVPGPLIIPVAEIKFEVSCCK
jgi:hypothetical protein